jgi:hypothetical protein
MYSFPLDIENITTKVIITKQLAHSEIMSQLFGAGYTSLSIDELANSYVGNFSMIDKIGDIMFAMFSGVYLHNIENIFISYNLYSKYVDHFSTIFIRSGFATYYSDDANEIIHYTGKDVMYDCSNHVITSTNKPHDSMSGRVIRRALFNLFKDQRLTILGSEHESILDYGANSIHIGNVRKPFNVFDDLSSYKSYDMRYKFDGQTKLYHCDYPMMRGKILYVGGCPGSHIINYLTKKNNLTIIDPAKIDIRLLKVGVKHIKDVVKTSHLTTGYDSLIVDIRRTIYTSHDNKVYWDMQISLENCFIMAIVIIMKLMNPNLIYSYKYHPGYNAMFTLSPPVFLTYNRFDTLETRVYGTQLGYVNICRERYIDQMNEWSRIASFEMMKAQSKFIACVMNRNMDFAEVKDDGSVFISTFAISNTSNKRSEVFKLLDRLDHFIAIIPTRGESGGSSRVLVDEFSGKAYQSNTKVLDHIYSPYEFMKRYTYNLFDIIANTRPSGLYNPHTSMFSTWFIVSNFPLWDPTHDTVYDSQSYLMRVESLRVRKKLRLNRDDMYQLRADLSGCPNDGYNIYKDGEMINPAGHLINYLLTAHTYHICFKRVMSKYRANITKNFINLNHLIAKNLIVERVSQYKTLWHTKNELFFGIFIAFKLLEYLGIKPNIDIFDYVYESVTAITNSK